MYVECMGAVYRLTKKQYRDFLTGKANGTDKTIDAVGGKFVARIKNVTDMDAEAATDELHWEFARGGRRCGLPACSVCSS